MTQHFRWNAFNTWMDGDRCYPSFICDLTKVVFQWFILSSDIILTHGYLDYFLLKHIRKHLKLLSLHDSRGLTHLFCQKNPPAFLVRKPKSFSKKLKCVFLIFLHLLERLQPVVNVSVVHIRCHVHVGVFSSFKTFFFQNLFSFKNKTASSCAGWWDPRARQARHGPMTSSL